MLKSFFRMAGHYTTVQIVFKRVFKLFFSKDIYDIARKKFRSPSIMGPKQTAAIQKSLNKVDEEYCFSVVKSSKNSSCHESQWKYNKISTAFLLAHDYKNTFPLLHLKKSRKLHQFLSNISNLSAKIKTRMNIH